MDLNEGLNECERSLTTLVNGNSDTFRTLSTHLAVLEKKLKYFSFIQGITSHAKKAKQQSVQTDTSRV